MRFLWPQLREWLDAGRPFALATVTAVSGSAPRAPGSCMAIDPERLRFLGSVSSGCLDAEVVEAARTALRTGEMQRLRFGPDGQPPWSNGLTCGGWVDVRVEPWWGFHSRATVREMAPLVRRWLEDDAPGVVVSTATHHVALEAAGPAAGDGDAIPTRVLAAARAQLAALLPPREVELDGGNYFVRTLRGRPRLLLIGGGDLALRLIAFAREAGFFTIVVDPRKALTVRETYPTPPDQLTRAWPQKVIPSLQLSARDAAIALTHDPKIDDPALLALLETDVGYLGALGSTRSHATRLQRLRAEGTAESALARIRGPAGLHLGTPDATGIALGIIAGVVQWQAEAERKRALVALAPAQN